MAFAQTTNSRIAGHNADGRSFMSDKRRPCANTRSGSGSFRPGMPTSNNDHVKIRMFHVKHSLLPKLLTETKTCEYFIKQVFYVNTPNHRFKCADRNAQLFCRKFRSFHAAT